MDTAVSLNIRKSSLLWKIFNIVHVATGLLVLIYPTVLPVKVCALILVAFSAINGSHYIKNQAQITRLQFSGEQSFVWLNGHKVPCDIVGNPFVSHFLVILSLRTKNHGAGRSKKIGAILLPDSAAGDELRKVRVYLLTEFSSTSH